jgi:PPOX class probable F420-dependent enzyme
MALAHAISNTSIRFYESIRSKRASTAASNVRHGDLRSLQGHKYALIVTFRANGEPVPTPVWFGLDDGRLFFRSVATGAKLRRIAVRPGVVVAACTANGHPRGPSIHGRARLLTAPADESRAEAAIRRNYGLARRIYVRFVSAKVAGTYVEIRPTTDSH